jgi:hypothetical protein
MHAIKMYFLRFIFWIFTIEKNQADSVFKRIVLCENTD